MIKLPSTSEIGTYVATIRDVMSHQQKVALRNQEINDSLWDAGYRYFFQVNWFFMEQVYGDVARWAIESSIPYGVENNEHSNDAFIAFVDNSAAVYFKMKWGGTS